MHTLDAYVDMDYSLVYFHFGLTSKNKPPLRWLWEVYKALDRRYKKNLKLLDLVQPTNLIPLTELSILIRIFIRHRIRINVICIFKI